MGTSESSALPNSVAGIATKNWTQSRTIIFIWSLIFILCVSKNCDSHHHHQPSPVVLNRCCPDGSKYDSETSECVQIVKVLVNESEKHDSNNNNTLSLLNLPKQLLLFIPKQEGNSSDEPPTFQFMLEHNPTASKCANGHFTVQIKLNSIISSTDNQSDNDTKSEIGYKIVFAEDGGSNDSFSLVNVPSFTTSGQLRIQKRHLGVNSMEYFSKPEYCIASLADDDGTLSIVVCNPTCTGNTPCIRKCCDLNQVWDTSRGKKQRCSLSAASSSLENGGRQWSPVFYKNVKTKATDHEVEAIYPHYKIAPPISWCNRSIYKPIIHDQIKFRITTTGDIYLRLSRYDWNSTSEGRQYYCIDGGGGGGQSTEKYSEKNSILFACGPQPPPSSTSQPLIYGILMSISCVFLLLTILVYLLLWEKQNVHGWTRVCYTTSLFFMFLFFTLSYFAQFHIVQGNHGTVDTYCHTIGVSLHFFFLQTWCWLAMINLDLFWTFNKLKPITGRSKGRRRFVAYMVFSLMVPTSIISVALTLDSTYRDDLDSGVIIPEYGKRRCQLDTYAQLVFAYGPAGILLAFNLFLFSITIYTMYRIQQSTKIATMSSSKRKHQQQTMRLFVKLFFVSGIPWITEIISWTVTWYSGQIGNGQGASSWYWILFDVVNIMQSIAIFYIFVCKRDILHSLEQKYPAFKRFTVRVMLDPETTDRIIATHPRLKGILMPFTRVAVDLTSITRNTQKTETTIVGGSVHEGTNGSGIRMETRKKLVYLPKI